MLISKKKKKKKTSFLFLVVGGWVEECVQWPKKKKKIVPAIKTIYFPIVKKLNLREEENYKITKLQKSNHIGRRCITNINLCL